MKKQFAVLLLAAGLIPAVALAWSPPGQDFSGEMALGGPITSTRNPWVWQLGEGTESLDVKVPANRQKQAIPVPLPAVNILLGKTTQATPAGREGLAPLITYGRGVEGFSLSWTSPGIARITLPVTGDKNTQAGVFTFQMKGAGLQRSRAGDESVYAVLYEDLKGNGLPPQAEVMAPEQTAGALQTMFSGEGPSWLAQGLSVNGVVGVSRFTDATIKQLEGVYGAQAIANSGELHLKGEIPSRWRVSLPVSIEYQ